MLKNINSMKNQKREVMLETKAINNSIKNKNNNNSQALFKEIITLAHHLFNTIQILVSTTT